MTTDQEPVKDEIAEQAGELILEADEQYQQNKAEQEAFLETVAQEEGAEVLETTCNLVGDYTVNIKAKLSGDIMDRMGALDDRVERIDAGEARAYEISETADAVSQLLADVIDDDTYTKELFYTVYESEGMDPLGVMLERAFKSLKEEKERREGVANGFRKNA